uniref:Uncharacterized protein n=1 Tax=Solanum lycopersicum TaxID=4081 RepID=A0A3Q7F200_SOLLC
MAESPLCVSRAPRLFIKDMNMRKIKSYGGEQRVGPFHKGEIEQISLMKPKAQSAHDEGFLEYLEDIIGTNKYVEKIAESLKQSRLSFRRPNNRKTPWLPMEVF